MYSYFEDEDIEVVNWKGLKSFFKEWENQKEVNDYTKEKSMIKKDIKGKEYLTFEYWNDIKLISYWYEVDLIFLTLIAKYVEGRVEWDFENKDETGEVNFEDGECNITTGQINYYEWEAKRDINMDKLNPRLKKLMILNNL